MCDEERDRCLYVPILLGTNEQQLCHSKMEGLCMLLQQILCLTFTTYLEDVIIIWSELFCYKILQ